LGEYLTSFNVSACKRLFICQKVSKQSNAGVHRVPDLVRFN